MGHAGGQQVRHRSAWLVGRERRSSDRRCRSGSRRCRHAPGSYGIDDGRRDEAREIARMGAGRRPVHPQDRRWAWRRRSAERAGPVADGDGRVVGREALEPQPRDALAKVHRADNARLARCGHLCHVGDVMGALDALEQQPDRMAVGREAGVEEAGWLELAPIPGSGRAGHIEHPQRSRRDKAGRALGIHCVCGLAGFVLQACPARRDVSRPTSEGQSRDLGRGSAIDRPDGISPIGSPPDDARAVGSPYDVGATARQAEAADLRPRSCVWVDDLDDVDVRDRGREQVIAAPGPGMRRRHHAGWSCRIHEVEERIRELRPPGRGRIGFA